MRKIITILRDRALVRKYVELVSKYRRARTVVALSVYYDISVSQVDIVLEEQNKYFIKLNNKKIAKWKSKKVQV